MRRIRSHLTYANVMATIAVFGVLAGGGAYAASKIGPDDIAKNAVRSKHIKKKAVRSKHIRNEAVKTPKIKNGAVTAAKLADDVDIPEATLWAVVDNSPSGPTLLQGSGADSVSDSGTGRVKVRFNRAVDDCSYAATGFLEEEGTATYVHPLIPVVFRDLVNHAATELEVQTYSEDTGTLNSDNYNFSVAVFC